MIPNLTYGNFVVYARSHTVHCRGRRLRDDDNAGKMHALNPYSSGKMEVMYLGYGISNLGINHVEKNEINLNSL